MSKEKNKDEEEAFLLPTQIFDLGETEEAIEAKEQLLKTRAAILFVHGLDKRIEESTIYRIFNNYNVMYIKLAKDETTGISLGYAFVGFGNRQKAGQALKEVNYTRLMGKTVRLAWYDRTKDNPRKKLENNIFVKNIPKTVTPKEFHEYFEQYGEIDSAKIAEDVEGESLGYGYVLYQETASAKKAIEENHGKLWKDTNMKLYVCQLERKRKRKKIKFNNLYVRNIPRDWDVEQLKKYFSEYGEISSAIIRTPNPERVDKKTPKCISSFIFTHNYGFVCFKSIGEPADKAVNKVPYLKLKDVAYNKQIEEWAKILREHDVSEDDVYRCTCFIYEHKHTDKLDTEEGIEEIKKLFEELMKYYDGYYVVRNVEDRLHCCQAMKKKERIKRLKVICERLKKKAREKFKYCNLYIKHLPDTFTSDNLKDLFEPFGPIRSAKIIIQGKNDPKLKGVNAKSHVFAFVCFFDPETAKKAKEELNGKPYIKKGPRLYVDYHQTKKERLEFIKLKMIRDSQPDYRMPDASGEQAKVRRAPPIYTPIVIPDSELDKSKQNIKAIDNLITTTTETGEKVHILPYTPIVREPRNTLVPVSQNIPMPPFYQVTPMVPIIPSGPVMPVNPNAPMVPVNPNVPIVPVNTNVPMIPMNPNVPMVPMNPNVTVIPVNANVQMMPHNVQMMPHNVQMMPQNIQMMPVNAKTQKAQQIQPSEKLVEHDDSELNEPNVDNIINENIENQLLGNTLKEQLNEEEPDFNINIFENKGSNTNVILNEKKDSIGDKIYEGLMKTDKYSQYQYVFRTTVKVMKRFPINQLEALVKDTNSFYKKMDIIVPLVRKYYEERMKIEKEKKKAEKEKAINIFTMGLYPQYEEEVEVDDENWKIDEQKEYNIDFQQEGLDWENIIRNIILNSGN